MNDFTANTDKGAEAWRQQNSGNSPNQTVWKPSEVGKNPALQQTNQGHEANRNGRLESWK
jgi:hypothetical protein